MSTSSIGAVHVWRGEECRFRFFVKRPVLEACIVRRDVDWVNSLFLSCRLEAERDGPYNEFVYNFFRSLSAERMAYTERYYSEEAPAVEVFEVDGYSVQRRCPHLKADLTRFGSVEDASSRARYTVGSSTSRPGSASPRTTGRSIADRSRRSRAVATTV